MGCGQPGQKSAKEPLIVLNPEQFKQLLTQNGPLHNLTQDQLVAHEAKAIVYSCMDFRLLDDIVIFMDKNGYNKNYDQFILAGASLSFIRPELKHWRKAAREHLDLALKLHKIKEIICIEHERCGAYKMYYPDLKPEDEKQQHIKNVLTFEKKISKSHEQLTLHAFFMHLDGSCDKIN
jgi:carbonic anhydrase